MTPEQKTELEYLIDLLREASKWNTEQGDDALRLEVDLRINNILNSVEVEGETEVQGEPEVSPVLTQDDYKAIEAAKLNEHLASPEKVNAAKEKWKHGRVRVTIDGKLVWKLESECHKEIIPGFEKKWHWVWNGPEDKQAQMDAMWEEHEQGE